MILQNVIQPSPGYIVTLALLFTFVCSAFSSVMLDGLQKCNLMF
jgi:hypothetical protein